MLVDLFRKAGLEYSLFLRSDVMLENLHFSAQDRDELLRLVMEQANADYTVENGIWYVFDIQRADVLKKLKTVRQIPLSHVAAQDLPALLPQELATQSLYRIDRGTNSIILTGATRRSARWKRSSGPSTADGGQDLVPVHPRLPEGLRAGRGAAPARFRARNRSPCRRRTPS